MEDLKTCPFCGRKDVEIKGTGFSGYYVECGRCAVRMGCFSDGSGDYCGDFNTQQEAISAWNERADQESTD